VYDGRYYWIIQRNNDWIFQEVIPCKFHSDMFYPPIKFYPWLIDDKRVVVCIEEYSDNIFLENNDGRFDLIKESKIFLQENPKVAAYLHNIYYGDDESSEEENEELSEEDISLINQEINREIESQKWLLSFYDKVGRLEEWDTFEQKEELLLKEKIDNDDQANQELAQNEWLNKYFEDIEQYTKENPFEYGNGYLLEEENEELSIEENISLIDWEANIEIVDQKWLLSSYDEVEELEERNMYKEEQILLNEKIDNDEANQELAQNEWLNQYVEDVEEYTKGNAFW